jgi:hypothetical protein
MGCFRKMERAYFTASLTVKELKNNFCCSSLTEKCILHVYVPVLSLYTKPVIYSPISANLNKIKILLCYPICTVLFRLQWCVVFGQIWRKAFLKASV